jgi:hypothetical protein
MVKLTLEEAAEKVGIKGILVNSNIDLSEDLLIL